jgi:hypothetical protein
LPALPAVHVPKVGTTVYTAVWVTFDELLKLPVIEVFCVLPAPPVNEEDEVVGDNQVYVVLTGTTPFNPFDGVTVKPPLHIVVLI